MVRPSYGGTAVRILRMVIVGAYPSVASVCDYDIRISMLVSGVANSKGSGEGAENEL